MVTPSLVSLLVDHPASRQAYAFDHIRRFYWERCTTDQDRRVSETLFRTYWRYMMNAETKGRKYD